MIKHQKKMLSQRDKELFLGNLVTWGSIVITFVLTISFAPADPFESGESPQAQAVAQIAGAEDVVSPVEPL